MYLDEEKKDKDQDYDSAKTSSMPLKPVAHFRKELSKLPHEVISSVVSLIVQLSFCDFSPREAVRKICHI